MQNNSFMGAGFIHQILLENISFISFIGRALGFDSGPGVLNIVFWEICHRIVGDHGTKKNIPPTVRKKWMNQLLAFDTQQKKIQCNSFMGWKKITYLAQQVKTILGNKMVWRKRGLKKQKKIWRNGRVREVTGYPFLLGGERSIRNGSRSHWNGWEKMWRRERG